MTSRSLGYGSMILWRSTSLKRTDVEQRFENFSKLRDDIYGRPLVNSHIQKSSNNEDRLCLVVSVLESTIHLVFFFDWMKRSMEVLNINKDVILWRRGQLILDNSAKIAGQTSRNIDIFTWLNSTKKVQEHRVPTYMHWYIKMWKWSELYPLI